MKQHTMHPHRVWADTPRAEAPPRRPGLWLAGVQLILAYEWLISSLNKLFDSHFDAGLVGLLQGSTGANPYTWYVAILQRIVIPNHTLVAFLTPLGEMVIALTLVAGSALWTWRLTPRATMYGAAVVGFALLGSAFLSLNYFFQGGTTLPWINTSNAFTEGVDIDILIPLLSVLLAASYLDVFLQARSGILRANTPIISPVDARAAERQAAFTVVPEGEKSTMKSLLGTAADDGEIWVDSQGVYWTATQLLEKSSADLLAQCVACAGLSVDADGRGHLDESPAPDNHLLQEFGLPRFNLVRLRYNNGTPGPVMFVVAGQNHDPRTGVMALTGPVGEFLELRPATPSDVPAWPLPDDAHAPFSEGDRREQT